MTERLEEIQSRVWKDKGTYAMGDNKSRKGYIYTLSDYDYEWLIKQAERVQELEKQNKRYRKAIKECIERMNKGGAGTRSFVYEKLTEVLEDEK